MLLSIIVTTKNRKAELLKCIESIKVSHVLDFTWELIIVDDFSNDGTEKLTPADFSPLKIKIIHNSSPQMMIGTRNLGATKAKGRYILFIDDDNVIDKNMIKDLVELAEQNSKFGIIGPSMYFLNTKKRYFDFQKINFFTGKTTGQMGKTPRKAIYESDGVPNVFLIRKDVFDKIGYFEETLISDYTEPDFSLKALHAGFKSVILTSAITYHNINNDVYDNNECRHIGGHRPQVAYCLIRNRTVIIFRYGKIYHKFIYICFFSWLWPLIYSIIAIRHQRFDLINLYWSGFKDGLIYSISGKLKSQI